MSIETSKLPPQNLEAEMSVLGGILLDNRAISQVQELISEDDFYVRKHGIIFRAMCELIERHEPVDLITLTELLSSRKQLNEVGGAPFLALLVDYVPTAANIAHYCKIVREKSLARKVIDTAREIVQKGYEPELSIEDLLDTAQQRIFDISQNRSKRSFTPLKSILKEAIATIEKLYEKKEHITGIPSGFVELDLKTAGFQPGDLIIIAGRPSMGKTAFALNICQYAAIHSHHPVGCAIFSLEMSKEQLVTRLLCSESRLDASRLRTGNLSESDWHKLSTGAANLLEAPIYIDDTPGITVQEMRAKTRRLKMEKEIGLVMVDYLQLMQGSTSYRNESRQHEISEISRSLKALAKELNVPVIALSQLNRGLESRSDKRPLMSDLRESGAIEQDADVIMFVYRDVVYCEACKKGDGSCTKEGHERQAEIIIGKQRNGPIGTVELVFMGEHTRFENLARNT